jgi:hypothetical protein
MVAGVGRLGRRVGVTVALAVGLLAGGSAGALTLSYDVIDGTAGVFAPTGTGIFIVSQNLDGLLTLETPAALDVGATLEYTDFAMAGTGRLCPGCDTLGIEIALSTSAVSTLEVLDDPVEPGTFASAGELFTIWTITGDTWTLDLAVSAVTRFFGSRNDISSSFFSHNYQITSIVPLGDVPDGVDLSALRVFKFDSAVVPEPGTLLLMAGGLLGLASARASRRRR